MLFSTHPFDHLVDQDPDTLSPYDRVQRQSAVEARERAKRAAEEAQRNEAAKADPEAHGIPLVMSGWIVKSDLSGVYEVVDAPLNRDTMSASKNWATYGKRRYNLGQFHGTRREALSTLKEKLGAKRNYVEKLYRKLTRRYQDVCDDLIETTKREAGVTAPTHRKVGEGD